MNTSKAKKQEPKNNAPEIENIKVESFRVENVRVVSGKNGDVVFFTLVLNGVTIYNVRVATGKQGDFISWPQVKGKDNKYYNQVYVRLSDEDQIEILSAIQKEIDKM